MSEGKRDEMLAQSEPWPLYDNWWISFISKEHHKHKGFDEVFVYADGPSGYRRKITSFMVPEIDGMVCESHSFPGFLIKQNIEKLQKKVEIYEKALAKIDEELDFFISGFAKGDEPGDVAEAHFQCQKALKQAGEI